MSQIVDTLLAWSVRRQSCLAPAVALLPKARAALLCCASKAAEDLLFVLQIMHKSWNQRHGFSDARRWEGMAGMGCGAVCWGYSTLLQALNGCVEWCLLSRKRWDFIFLTWCFILRLRDLRARSNKKHYLQGNRISGSADKWMCPDIGAGLKCLHRWISPVSSRPLQLGVFWCWPILHGSPDIPG